MAALEYELTVVWKSGPPLLWVG